MTTEAPPCVHWWKIARPEGPTSIGRCIYCGREKEYLTTKYPDYNNEPLNKTLIPYQQEQVWD